MKTRSHKTTSRIPIRFFLAAVLVFVFAGCSRQGCLDTDAENYEPKATVSCSCCQFTGKGIAWYRKPFYEKVKASGANQFYFFMADKEVGHVRYIAYFSDSPPIFSSNGSDYVYYNPGDDPVAIVPIGGLKQKKVLLTCRDEKNNLLWQDSVEITANKLTTFELR